MLLGVAVLGLSLAFQGWRSRLLDFDLIPYVDETAALLAEGRLPEKGTLTSLASYTPPGTAWLLAPGMAVTDDARRYEMVGSAALYLGTLAGVFALTALCAPQRFAILAVVLWGLSESGLFFGHSLWPRGHPFFFVWMVYFTLQWVRRRNAWYLAAALIAWSAGMYVFIEIAPAFAILPAVWWFYRPPTRVGCVALAGVVTLLIWLPYLRFEAERGFIDLRSQLFHQAIYQETNAGWCDPSLFPPDWIVASHESDRAGFLRRTIATAAGRIEHGPPLFITNFRSALTGAWLLLAAGVVGGLLVPAVATVPTISMRALQTWGVLLLLLPAVVNEWTVSRFLSGDGNLDGHTVTTLRSRGAVALLVGVGLLIGARRFPEWLERSRAELADVRSLDNLKLVALCLVLPWAALLIAVEGPRPERFWWLWAVQAVVLAAGLALLRAGPTRMAISTCVLAAVVANGLTVSRIQSWRADGWPGRDNPGVEAIDSLAASMAAKGLHAAAIGYEIGFDRFMATFHAADSRYKVGSELDLVLLTRHGITNTNTCGEGAAGADAYRVVAHTESAKRRERFNVPRDPRLRPIYSSPSHTVLAR